MVTVSPLIFNGTALNILGFMQKILSFIEKFCQEKKVRLGQTQNLQKNVFEKI